MDPSTRCEAHSFSPCMVPAVNRLFARRQRKLRSYWRLRPLVFGNRQAHFSLRYPGRGAGVGRGLGGGGNLPVVNGVAKPANLLIPVLNNNVLTPVTGLIE
jgi:hypothetical protein